MSSRNLSLNNGIGWQTEYDEDVLTDLGKPVEDYVNYVNSCWSTCPPQVPGLYMWEKGEKQEHLFPGWEYDVSSCSCWFDFLNLRERSLGKLNRLPLIFVFQVFLSQQQEKKTVPDI